MSNTTVSSNSDSESIYPSKILVPSDGSPNALRALKVAIDLARTFHSKIVILNVISAPGILVEAPVGLGLPPGGVNQYYDQQEGGARNLVEQASSICKKQGINNVETQVVRAEKSVVEEIIALAAYKNIDLIVIGTRGLGGFKKLLMGSVSGGVVTNAACDVLVVR